MLYGLYLSASGMQAQEKRQDIITNNLANAPTSGFKRDLAIIRSRQNPAYEDASLSPYRSGILANQGGGVVLENGGVDLSQATLKHTGAPTDVALQGRGFFVLQGAAEGQTVLTRDGNFLINQNGALIAAASGRAVLDSEGAPITLNPKLPVNIDATGKISQSDGSSIQLKLADVTDPRHVIKLGSNLMTVDDPKMLKDISPDTTVRQGNLEESGVDPVVEMVNMMEGQRIFDANAKMISLQDHTLEEANGVGKIA